MSTKLGSDKYTYSNDDNEYASKYSSGRTSRAGGNNSGVDHMSSSTGAATVSTPLTTVTSPPAPPTPPPLPPPPPPPPPQSTTTTTTTPTTTASSASTQQQQQPQQHHHHHPTATLMMQPSSSKGGRDSVNSFEDSSVRNSQSGITDGGGGGGGGGANTSLVGLSSSRLGGSKLSGHTANNSSNYMGSTDTISRNQRETLHSRFDFIKVLGKGTYGKVKLANDKRTGKQVAIKIIHKNRIENKQDLARVRREIEFMSRLNHPHIVKILEVYESSEKIILVMEYASGGELYDYLNERKRVSEVEARGIFRQIVSAVHFLHKNRIVHRDLKLENILIDSNGDIKLADFGLSNNWSPNSLLYTFCGSPLYASPEIVNGFPYFGPEVDCWSLGVLLYTLVYGSMPFQGGDYNRLVKQITDGQFIVPRERSGAFGLIKKCLCTKAAKRASIDDIAEHWWVNVGYAYPPVVFYSYMPGSNKSGVQALGYEGSPKVSPSIPFGSMGKKTASSLVAAAQAAAAAAAAAAATSSGVSTGTPCTAGGGINTPVPSTVY